MTEHLILVDRTSHWQELLEGCPVTSASDYLSDTGWQQRKGLRVVNLCRSQRYLSRGYYCSLLAEARGHRVIPAVRSLRDLSRKSLFSLETEALDRAVPRILERLHRGLETTSFNVTFMLGSSPLKELRGLARELFETFRVPLIQVSFERRSAWRISAMRALGLQDLSTSQREDLAQALEGYLSKRWRAPRKRRQGRYDLAILHNPDEAIPPSDPKALKQFLRAARRHGLEAELITHRDYGRLGEFDALFIRETTAIDHPTYRFSRKAASEGLVVIDDPDSILRCTNKIYLAELLQANRVPTPQTVVVGAGELDRLERSLDYPMVIKVPDGSFSLGVYKVTDRQELEKVAKRLLKESDLMLAQAYTYTAFDWRVGILNGEPLYVCQYFMTQGHWQIYDHAGNNLEGDHRTLAVEEAPRKVVKTALKAARLIGLGFYGVDLKETPEGVVVIEVNDNPSVDAGVEDQVLGESLYDRIVLELLRRIEVQKRHQSTP